MLSSEGLGGEGEPIVFHEGSDGHAGGLGLALRENSEMIHGNPCS